MELKACPFCGSEVRIWRDSNDKKDKWITCDKCGESHLLSLWNTRPLEDAMRHQELISIPVEEDMRRERDYWKERAETYLFDQELYHKECDVLKVEIKKLNGFLKDSEQCIRLDCISYVEDREEWKRQEDALQRKLEMAKHAIEIARTSSENEAVSEVLTNTLKQLEAQ